MVGEYDIVSLVETHSASQDLHIPGFSKPWQITRKKTGKKSYGGIAVFVKEALFKEKVITRIITDNNDILWVRINSNSVDQDDIYVGTVYFSPDRKNGKITDGVLKKMSENVMEFQKKGEVILMGDFNARTGTLSDVINTQG